MTTIEPGASVRRPLTASELNRLAPLLKGETLSQQVAGELNDLIQKYLQEETQKERPPQAPPGESDNAGPRGLEQAASALTGMLAALKEEELERMAAAASMPAMQLKQTVASTSSQLAEIADASRKAVAAAARKDAAADDPLKNLIAGLVPIFERETGTEAGNSWHPIRNVYFSPFFDLVKGILDIVAPSEAGNNKALGSNITRALMMAREMKGSYLARTHGQGLRLFVPPSRK
jgi:hypothetical protein